MMNFPPDTPNLQSHLNTLFFIKREWDMPSRLKNFEQLCQDGEVHKVVDIGAHIGYFVQLCIERLETMTEMVAFEPEPQNSDVFRYNWGSKGGCKLVQKGIFYGMTEGIMRGTGDENPGGYIFEGVHDQHLYPHTRRLVPYAGIVQMTTLEEELTFVPDLIKMDVEGSEYNIIENSVALKHARYLMIDFHGHDLQFLQTYLAKQLPGYEVQYLGMEGYAEDYQNYAFLRNKDATLPFK
jgi:FkbM family methyltransferase